MPTKYYQKTKTPKDVKDIKIFLKKKKTKGGKSPKKDIKASMSIKIFLRNKSSS